MIVGIDPGKDNGIAIFEDDGTFKNMFQLNIDQMLDWFIEYNEPVSVVVIEDYVIFKKRALAQAGSNVPASRVIGAAEMFAKMKKAKLIKQRSDILPLAQMWSQKKLPKDHSISHQFAAYNHAFYWMVKNGLRKVALADRGNKYG